MTKIIPINDLETLIKNISVTFYESIYQHPWLKEVFKGVPQEHITSQQVDFMLGAFGGPQRYCGRNPGDAHPHIFIDESMWQERQKLLKEAFIAVGCPEEIQEKWFKIEEAFKRRIVMTDPSECQRRYTTDELIIVKKAA